MIGQQVGVRTLREISQAIANFVKPQIIPIIEHLFIDGKDVIKIEVSGSEKPYSAYGKYYMRSADEDRELSPTALKELMERQSVTDVLLVQEAPRQNLTFNKLKLAYVSAGLTVTPDTFETKVSIGNHRRSEEKLFDFASFKEAWQNACLHSRWDKGNPPAVYLFSDRIEIISTGGLPEDLSKDEFYRGISKPVNMKNLLKRGKEHEEKESYGFSNLG